MPAPFRLCILAVLLPLLSLTGCKDSKPDSEPAVQAEAKPKTYTLFWIGGKEPAGGIPVQITTPSDWTVEVGDEGGPKFRPPGVGEYSLEGLSVVAIRVSRPGYRPARQRG